MFAEHPVRGEWRCDIKVEKKDWIRGGGSRLQSGIQYHGVLSDDILYRCVWNISGRSGYADAGHKVY